VRHQLTTRKAALRAGDDGVGDLSGEFTTEESGAAPTRRLTVKDAPTPSAIAGEPGRRDPARRVLELHNEQDRC